MSYSFVYGSYTSTTGGSNFVRPYIYYQITVSEGKVNCHWWAGCDVKSGWTTNAKFTMTTTVSDGSASNRSATLDNQGWTGGPHAMIKDVDYNWDRGTSSKTLTIKATLKPYGKSASTATLSITIPALNQYQVTFNSTGGTATSWPKRPYGYKGNLPSVTRTGYDFQGWATSNGGTVAYKGGASYTVTKNITLYAVWKVTYIAPTIQGNIIGYRVSPETASIPEEDSNGTMAYVEFTTDSGTNVDYDNTYTATYTSTPAPTSGSTSSITLTQIPNENGTYTYKGVIGSENDFNIGTAYNIQVQVTNHSTTDTGTANLVTTATFILPKQVYAIDIAADSKRVAFGGVASDSSSGNTRSDFGIEVYGHVAFKEDSSSSNLGLWSSPFNNWALKIDDTDTYIYDKAATNTNKLRNMSRIRVTPVITQASSGGGVGTIGNIQAMQWGAVIQLSFNITSTTETASGGNIFKGTIENQYRPATYITGVSYYGGHAILCRINAAGELIVRNASSSSVALTETAGFGLTYLLV